MMKRLFIVFFIALALAAWPATAGAQSSPTIDASPDQVPPGAAVRVIGTCTPEAGDEPIDLVLTGDFEGGLVAADVPVDDTGAFATSFAMPDGVPLGPAELSATCGLSADVDPAAQIRVVEGSTPATPASTVVGPADTGELVAFWQDRLNDWIALSDGGAPAEGLTQIAVDGVFGPDTEDATRVFQDLNGTVPTDGVVHPEDRVALREAIDALESDDGVTDTVVAPGGTG